MALKLADVSHPAKEQSIHLNWTYRITEEFYQQVLNLLEFSNLHQGDEEKRLWGTVSPLMDRETGNVAKSQLGFVSFMVLPLYQAWTEEFENTKDLLQQVEANIGYWKVVQFILLSYCKRENQKGLLHFQIYQDPKLSMNHRQINH